MFNLYRNKIIWKTGIRTIFSINNQSLFINNHLAQLIQNFTQISQEIVNCSLIKHDQKFMKKNEKLIDFLMKRVIFRIRF